MPISIFASSYLTELRMVRHRLAELINDQAGTLRMYAHDKTIEWAYQVLDDLIREVESGTPNELQALEEPDA